MARVVLDHGPVLSELARLQAAAEGAAVAMAAWQEAEATWRMSSATAAAVANEDAAVIAELEDRIEALLEATRAEREAKARAEAQAQRRAAAAERKARAAREAAQRSAASEERRRLADQAARERRARAEEVRATAEPVTVRQASVPVNVAVRLRQTIAFGAGETQVPRVALPALNSVLKALRDCPDIKICVEVRLGWGGVRRGARPPHPSTRRYTCPSSRECLWHGHNVFVCAYAKRRRLTRATVTRTRSTKAAAPRCRSSGQTRWLRT